MDNLIKHLLKMPLTHCKISRFNYYIRSQNRCHTQNASLNTKDMCIETAKNKNLL